MVIVEEDVNILVEWMVVVNLLSCDLGVGIVVSVVGRVCYEVVSFFVM